MIPESMRSLSPAERAKAFVEALLAMETPPIVKAESDAAIDTLNAMSKRVVYLRKKEFEARRHAMTKASVEMLTEIIATNQETESMSLPPEYRIKSTADVDDETGESLYWSNEDGWVSKHSADKFSLADTSNLRLPTGGEWELIDSLEGVPLIVREAMRQVTDETKPIAAEQTASEPCDYDAFVASLTSRPSYGAIMARLGTTPGEAIEDFVGLGDGFDFMEPIGATGNLLHAAMGLVTEVGEMLQGSAFRLVEDFDRVNAIEELGDLEFYASLARQAIGVTRDEVVIGASIFEFADSLTMPKNDAEMLSGYVDGVKYLAIHTSELLDMVKKNLFYARPISIEKAIRVMAMIAFYLEMTTKILGVERATVIERNVAKLKKRYGSAFSADKANNRDLDSERVALEGGQS